MKLLHGTVLISWERYKALDRQFKQVTDPDERQRLERARRDALQQFRRAYIEQRVRQHVA